MGLFGNSAEKQQAKEARRQAEAEKEALREAKIERSGLLQAAEIAHVGRHDYGYDDLVNELEEDERVDALLSPTFGGTDKLMVVTDRRLLRMMGTGYPRAQHVMLKDMKAFNIDKARRVYEFDNDHSHLEFRYQINEYYAPVVAHFLASLERNLNRVNPPQVPAQPTTSPANDDPAEQLKKLNELLSLGAVTQAEYDDKKRELLARL